MLSGAAVMTGVVSLASMTFVTEQIKRIPSDGLAEDTFGIAAAIWGETAVVASSVGDGAETNSGAAYVYERVGGVWTEVAKLTVSDGAMDDNLGLLFGAAIFEDTIVLGAPYRGGGDEGEAYVFVRPAGGWEDMTETAKLTASDAAMDDNFGFAVAIDGATIVIGAPTGGNGAGAGALYLFLRPDGGWVDATENAKLTASDADVQDLLGYSVDIEGETIVAGAKNEGNTGAGNSDGPGAAYVFTRPAGGWSNGVETAKLTASDGESLDYLGWSVAIAGTTIVAGAMNDGNSNTASIDGSGSAYVFVMPEGGWADASQTAKLIDSNPSPSNLLGWSVQPIDDLILVGAPNENHAPATQDGQGAVNVYQRPAGGWNGTATESLKLTADDSQLNRYFGVCVLATHDWFLFGAHGAGPGSADPGAVYFFARDNDGDGVGNYAEECPDDADKLDAGACGCGVPEVDSDGDGAYDCIDADAPGAGGTSLGGDCCGGGLPAMLPLLLLGQRRSARARKRRASAVIWAE